MFGRAFFLDFSQVLEFDNKSKENYYLYKFIELLEIDQFNDQFNIITLY